MLIKNGRVFTIKKQIPTFEAMDIRTSGKWISEIGSALTPQDGEEIIDVEKKLVLPGLSNSHYHSYSNILKGTSTGEPLEIWALGTVALGGALDKREMRMSVQLGIAEMLHCGVTSCVDHIPHLTHVDIIAETYKDSGFRAGIAPMIHNLSDHFLLSGLQDYFSDDTISNLKKRTPMTVERYQELYEGWINRWHYPEENVQILLGPNAPQRASMELLEAMGELGRQHNLGVHTHLLESRWQAESSLDAGEDVVEKLAKAGMLSEKTTLAHCVWLTDKQIEQVASAGATIAHNATSNLFLGSGKAPIISYKKKGIRIALGTDGSNCATNQNLLEVARVAALLSRLEHREYEEWFTTDQLWKMATSNGSWCTGWANKVGTITEKSLADLVIVDPDDTAYYPEIDLPLQILFNLNTLDPTHVIIGGNMIMKDKKILTFDEEALKDELKASSNELHQKFKKELSGTQELYSNYKAAYLRTL